MFIWGHLLLCEPYAKLFGEKEAGTHLPVTGQAFAHCVASTNLVSVFESQGREVKMKGQ